MAYPISDVPRRIVYSGSAGVGPYAFTFEVLAATDIAVYKNQTLLTLTTDYTVSINAGTGTGTVTLVVAATGSDTVTLVGDRAIQRTSDFVTGGDLFANTLNEELDAQTIYAQQIDEKADRAIKSRVTDPTTLDMTLPAAASRANKLLGFTAGGQPTISTRTIAEVDAAVGSFVSGTGNNAATVIYDPAGTGAVPTTVQAKLRETVSVKDFGAVGDGVADDTAAMQAAHNTGQIVYYPPGTYKFTTLTNITAGGIIGAGQTQTILLSTNTTSADLITFTGPSVGGPQNSLTFRDFMLQGQAPTKTAGAGIKVSPATSDNIYAFASNVTVSYVPTGFDFVRASFFKLIACNLLAYTVAGVQVANANNNDAGDSEIIGCAFSTPYSSGSLPTGVKQLSSGGLRVIGNKFLGGNYGYWLNYTDSDGVGTNTSNLIISGNSIENFYSNAIAFTKASVSLTSFLNIVIADNEIAVALATPSAFLIATDSGSWLQNMTVTGNVMQLPGTTNSYGLALTGVTCLNISGNTFRGNGGTSLAIGLTSCVDAKIGTNVYSNITTPYALTTPGANNSVVLDSQSGVATTSSSGWSAYYGSLYIGPATTITFAQPFQVTPQATDVVFSLASGDGTVGAIVNSVSKTQLQFTPLSSRTPGYVATLYWKVFGVL